MKERVCATCQTNPARPGQKDCTGCHAAYMKRWRAADRAVSRGTISRGTKARIAKARRRLLLPLEERS